MKDNPDLMRQFAAATAGSMAQSGNDGTGMSKMLAGMFGGGSSGAPAPANARPAEVQAMQQQQQGSMSGPRSNAPQDASRARTRDVLDFMQRQDGDAFHAPDFPVTTREHKRPAVPSPLQPSASRASRRSDAIEIMSNGSDISDFTEGGRQKPRKRNTLRLDM
jgi:hypothetical protein